MFLEINSLDWFFNLLLPKLLAKKKKKKIQISKYPFGDGHVHTAILKVDNQQGPTV